MRTWVKATLGGVALIAVAITALTATGMYFVFRHMENRIGSEAEAVQTIDAVKARFGSRPPLVKSSPTRRRLTSGSIGRYKPTSRVDTIHVMNWKSDTGELIRTEVPLWLMRLVR